MRKLICDMAIIPPWGSLVINPALSQGSRLVGLVALFITFWYLVHTVKEGQKDHSLKWSIRLQMLAAAYLVAKMIS